MKYNLYSNKFFKDFSKTAEESAKELVPLFIKIFKPNSVIDLGCGLGFFIKSFIENGILDVCGIDGDWVPLEDLVIPKEVFIAKDLTIDLDIGRKFDVAISLEVAEHIPSDKVKIFLKNLEKCSNNIIFSAAIPYQGGTGHCNERWQSFWVNYFKHSGYYFIDVRPIIWNNHKIANYYRQNLLIFTKSESIKNEFYKNFYKNFDIYILDIVHPEIWQAKVDPSYISIKEYLFKFPQVLLAFLKRKINNFINKFLK